MGDVEIDVRTTHVGHKWGDGDAWLTTLLKGDQNIRNYFFFTDGEEIDQWYVSGVNS